MKKLLVIMALAAFIAAPSGFAFSASPDDAGEPDQQKKGETQENQGYGSGPAPCSGDHIPLDMNPWLYFQENGDCGTDTGTDTGL